MGVDITKIKIVLAKSRHSYKANQYYYYVPHALI